jgi:uncharacterized membrane protein YphA (DoxX/SURF4 family)
MSQLKKLLRTSNESTIILIRLIVGAVFLSEGIQKFLFPDKLGAGRFAKIGSFEITCGTLVLIGLLTRLASIPLIIIMLVAIATTKAEVLAHDGFWEMMHGSRTDWAMLLGSIYLLIRGGGRWSIDQKITTV